jgi:hypothetical protein
MISNSVPHYRSLAIAGKAVILLRYQIDRKQLLANVAARGFDR